MNFAAKKGLFHLCQLIVENIPENQLLGEEKKTPLHHAAENGHFQTFKTIFERVQEKNPRETNFHGQTPLHYAAKNGFQDICKLILENVFEKNPKGFLDKTPLHYAALNGLKGKYDSLLQIKHLFFITTWMWMNQKLA